jgi:hypothetical protein
MSVVTSDNYIDGHYNGVDDPKDMCSLCERKLGYPHIAWPKRGCSSAKIAARSSSRINGLSPT